MRSLGKVSVGSIFGRLAASSDVDQRDDVHCLDCGGWPIPGGAIFIPVVHCKNGTAVSDLDLATRRRVTPLRTVGFICELCFVWRLQRRAEIVSATSTPKSYYSFNKAKPLLQDKLREIQHKPIGLGQSRGSA